MKIILRCVALVIIVSLLLMPAVSLGSAPLWTFTPLSPTTIQLPANSTVVVQYIVQNQSKKPHTLIMKPIIGVSQLISAGYCPDSFTLATQQSCILTLQIKGSQIVNQLLGGPVVCQQSADGTPNPLLCYQPNPADILQINATAAQTFLYAGLQNGSIYYSTDNGSNWTSTLSTPSAGSPVNSVFVQANILYAATADGYIHYSTNNGFSWTSTSQPDGSSVNTLFVTPNLIYAGTANGSVYYSSNNGANWISTSQPDGSAVNSIFVTSNGLYAGTANGSVYYSTDNGVSWMVINGQPDGSAIEGIYVANNTLYVNTANEYTYTSTALTGGGTWTTFAQTVYSLFVDASNNTIYAGTQGGFVFSLTTGSQLGYVASSPVNSIYV